MSGENRQAEGITDIALGEDGVFRAKDAPEQGEAVDIQQHEPLEDTVHADIDQAAIETAPAPRKRGLFPILALGSVAAAIGAGLFYYSHQVRAPVGELTKVFATKTTGDTDVATGVTDTADTALPVLEVPKVEVPDAPEISLDKVTEAVGDAVESAADTAESLAKGVAETASGIADGVGDAAGQAGAAIAETTSGVAEGIGNAAGTIAEGAGEATKAAVSAVEDAADSVYIRCDRLISINQGVSF